MWHLLRILFKTTTGYGFLIPVFVFLDIMLSGYLLTEHFKGSDSTTHLWVMLGSSLAVFSLPAWFIGRKVNRDNSDPHVFLFIPMEFWAFVYPIVLAVSNWPK